MTNDHPKSAASSGNPTNLPPRYDIRRLTPQEAQWAAAILSHSNIFHSTVFPKVYPDAKGARFNKCMHGCDYLVDHQIQSDMSFGVFDLEYQYKRPESAATGGKFYWDPRNDDVTGDELLKAMDFPLVSIALAYDGANALDMARIVPLIEAIPLYHAVFDTLNRLDKRNPESWKPKAPCEVLMRNATSTRHDYEGKGLAAALARFLMREAASKGYKAANIECLNDAVTHIWSNPPKPFTGEVVASFQTEDYTEVDEQGNTVRPFGTARQRVTRCYTTF